MSHKNKFYITLGLLVVIMLCLAVFLIYPVFQDIQDASRQILSDQGKESFISDQNIILSDFKTKYKEYGSHLENVDKFLVDAQNPLDFIKFLEKTAADSVVTRRAT